MTKPAVVELYVGYRAMAPSCKIALLQQSGEEVSNG